MTINSKLTSTREVTSVMHTKEGTPADLMESYVGTHFRATGEVLWGFEN